MSQGAKAAQIDLEPDDQDDGVKSIARYSTKTFVTWRCFFIKEKTVFKSLRLWQMMAFMSLLSLAVASVTVLVVPNPHVLKVGKFTDISKFLNVIVGLLLGFFMSSAMSRWLACCDGFLQMLDAIRNLQLQFIGLGVPSAETGLCMRYGLLSAWLMYFSLLEDVAPSADGEVSADVAQKTDEMISHFQRQSRRMRRAEAQACSEMPDPPHVRTSFVGSSLDFTQKEWSALRTTHDPAGMVWMWIVGLIGRLAQDGFIPPMASPTYGRIMNLCQQAHAGIREIAGTMKVQPPLMYTHMLATIVHVNNILNAVTFGLVVGLWAGTYLQAYSMHPTHTVAQSSGDVDIEGIIFRESQRDGQTAVVTFMYCVLGPCAYQALLLIALGLAQPFDKEETSIPLHTFLVSLERDLQDGTMVSNQMSFEKPCFKPPNRASAEIVPEELQKASLFWAQDE